ncbi:hypothetical protein STCU_10731 [Strigomonas culicis]|uniref:Uncharacterized protein n=1 Tax=Strigomonas culicis TaxID=28005 RepID=S9TLK4_9TRYP|nr:hypothetical protein STCU_10731 [Strigomonas culicis]|eukprot:EPY17243.1 hypothetical protein STCU_10731 [Strigomonas culicis]
MQYFFFFFLKLFHFSNFFLLCEYYSTKKKKDKENRCLQLLLVHCESISLSLRWAPCSLVITIDVSFLSSFF